MILKYLRKPSIEMEKRRKANMFLSRKSFFVFEFSRWENNRSFCLIQIGAELGTVRCKNIISDKDYHGSDLFIALNVFQANSAAECALLCELEPTCVAWTLNPNKNCWLKNSVPALVANVGSYAGVCHG